MSPPPITCHVLDVTIGKPAQNVTCAIYHLSEKAQMEDDQVIPSDPLKPFALAKTNQDGRVPQWSVDASLDEVTKEKIGISSAGWTLKPGIYKIRFHTSKYFQEREQVSFFPFVDIHFVIGNPPDKHYHIPLLLSNHGYTTYRGS